MKNKILLTGSTGFVGSVIIEQFKSSDSQLCPVVRYIKDDSPQNAIEVGDIDGNTDYSGALSKAAAVIHVAARVHIMSDLSVDPLAEFREVNTLGTLNLARQAADAGVARFVFVSSIKVNGESTSNKLPFQSSDKHSPEDPYGISKSEAEFGLQKIAKETEMEVVIIRPPLVYGPGVKANFLNLLKLSATKLPLPFGLIKNKRSMVYVENLVDLIVTCVDHSNAANKIFLASDGDDLSLARLLTLMRKSMGKPAWLLPVPMFIFKLAGMITGKSDIIDRLIGDLQVDISNTKTHLNWIPTYSVEQGIQATVDDFIANKNMK